MGNFSRDPKIRLADSVSKHYVGVRLQQGVPLLDADWNEMEDLRRHEMETLGTWFIGSGVPSGSDGFRIMARPVDNDFSIGKGIILVKGKKIYNENDNVTYSNQPQKGLINGLSTPTEDTAYLVYLVTWEEEIDGQEDQELIDNRIGVETCLRLKRQWVVRVIAGSEPGSLPPETGGHLFYPLALINRPANNGRITFEMITDLRRTHLTLADSTRSPLAIYGSLGTIIYSQENFAQLMDLTEKAYFNILKSDLFMSANFAAANPMETVMISAVFNGVMQRARAAFIQASTGNVSNQDGLKVLEELYYAQNQWVTEIKKLIAENPDKVTTTRLLNDLSLLLEGGSTGSPLGLKNAVLVKKDLRLSMESQQKINLELGNRTQILPHGHLVITFLRGPSQGTIIKAGQTYRYEYQVTFERTTPGSAIEETFDIRLAMDPPGWTAQLADEPGNTLKLNTGEQKTIKVDIDIPLETTIPSAGLVLNVRSQKNPSEMDTTNTEVVINIDSDSTQPNPLRIDLLSPAINVSEDILPVGRGGPFGRPGKGINLKFRFSYLTDVEVSEKFIVSFVSDPSAAFDVINDLTLSLGGPDGKTTEPLIGFQASGSATNGTAGTLTVHMKKESDPETFYELIIKLRVQK